MKRRTPVIITIVVALAVIGILLSTQFGVTREKEIVVPLPIVEVSPVVTDMENWPHWFPAAGSYRFEVINRNPAGMAVKARRDGIQVIYVLSAIPDSNGSCTRVKWTTVTSGYDWLKEKLFSRQDNSPGSLLVQLKRYFDDPRGFYEFDIRLAEVEDTLVLTRERTIRKAGLPTALQGLWDGLANYAAQEHVETNMDSCRMATFYDQKGDSIRIAAGIPVSVRVPPGPNGMRVLEMPAKGKMLVGKLQGRYGDLARLYGAMRKYIFDKKLKVIGAPYEKFYSRGRSSADSLHMTIELHFPVL